MTMESVPDAKSALSAPAPPVSLPLLLPSPLPPTAPARAGQTALSPATPLPVPAAHALSAASPVTSVRPSRKTYPASLHALPPATPATSPPTAPRSLPAAVHRCAGRTHLLPVQAMLCGPASHSASAAMLRAALSPPAPCTPAIFPPDVCAGLPPLL